MIVTAVAAMGEIAQPAARTAPQPPPISPLPDPESELNSKLFKDEMGHSVSGYTSDVGNDQNVGKGAS